MLETINDYFSFIVMIMLLFFSMRIISGIFSLKDESDRQKHESIIFDYQNNDDDWDNDNFSAINKCGEVIYYIWEEWRNSCDKR